MNKRILTTLSLCLTTAACSGVDMSQLRGTELRAALAGTYAVHDRVASISTLPGMGEFPMLGHYYGLTKITGAGNELAVTQHYCFGEVEWDGPVEILMSPEAIAATPPFEATLTLDETSDEVIVSRPLLEVAVGFRRNGDDTLPTGPADERVFDADGDGFPGVTVHMQGPVSGEIYIARIERNRWEASVTPEGHLMGFIWDTSEQVILDASDPVLMLDIEDVPDPDATKSTVHLIPVDPSYDCEQLAATYASLGL